MARKTGRKNKHHNAKPPFVGLIETPTTILQKQTERECQPYFVDLSALPEDQRRHLQQLGLLSTNEKTTNANDTVQLLRDKHRTYLEGVWRRPLKAPFVSLDSSRPWMLYWCLHAYDLLSSSSVSSVSTNKSQEREKKWITATDGANMVNTLEDCWQGYYTAHNEIPSVVAAAAAKDDFYFSVHEDDEREATTAATAATTRYYCGGFGGGPGQMPHAATTYAAVLALCILATSQKEDDEPNDDNDDDDDNNDDTQNDEYRKMHYSERAKTILREIRIPLYRWMVSLQTASGGYRMQHDGEIDVRATYTIVCCSKLLKCLEGSCLQTAKVVDYVRSCQTYEGGMGGEPFSEAHGGYTFCAVAALKLMGKLHDHSCFPNTNTASEQQQQQQQQQQHPFDTRALIGWLARRQGTYEGGFMGRSNKLVDGCYSFWQGGAMAIASSCASMDTTTVDNDNDDPWLLQQQQQQRLSDNSNNTKLPLSFPLLFDVFLLERYILLCAQEVTGGLRDKPSKPRDFYHTCYNLSGLSVAQHCNDDDDDGFGDPIQTLVETTHPCYNIRTDRVAAILDMEWE